MSKLDDVRRSMQENDEIEEAWERLDAEWRAAWEAEGRRPYKNYPNEDWHQEVVRFLRSAAGEDPAFDALHDRVTDAWGMDARYPTEEELALQREIWEQARELARTVRGLELLEEPTKGVR